MCCHGFMVELKLLRFSRRDNSIDSPVCAVSVQVEQSSTGQWGGWEVCPFVKATEIL